MTKPTAPANLADVSTWTLEQMAYAAPLIAEKASTAAKELREEIKAHAYHGNLETAAGFAKIAVKYEATAAFWSAVAAGDSPKVPTFLKAQRVQSYEQTNKRLRPAKTRYAGPKDWGVWSR